MMDETCNKQQDIDRIFRVDTSRTNGLHVPKTTRSTAYLPRFPRLLSVTLISLVLACTLTMLGCDDDDDESTVTLENVRVSDTLSVFRVLENGSFRFTASGGGIFGVPEGRMEFGAVTIDANGVPRAPFRLIDEVNVVANGDSISAEGDSDGVASCNFLFTSSDFPPGMGPQVSPAPIQCKLCDFRISAPNVPIGASRPGQLEWDLALSRDAIDNPDFTSVVLTVTVGVNDAGDLVSINGESVTVDE